MNWLAYLGSIFWHRSRYNGGFTWVNDRSTIGDLPHENDDCVLQRHIVTEAPNRQPLTPLGHITVTAVSLIQMHDRIDLDLSSTDVLLPLLCA